MSNFINRRLGQLLAEYSTDELKYAVNEGLNELRAVLNKPHGEEREKEIDMIAHTLDEIQDEIKKREGL